MNVHMRFFFVLVIMALVSCKKEKPPVTSLPHPEMEYIDLNNRSVVANTPAFSFDVNHDGSKDLAFTTLFLGDPIYKVDKVQFLVATNKDVNLPVDANEQVPVMNSGDSIVTRHFDGYHWYDLSTIVLVQKVISFDHPPFWEGMWKNAEHKYLPYQVITNNLRYNGWVELSVDIVNERVILHKAAICKEADKTVKAGK